MLGQRCCSHHDPLLLRVVSDVDRAYPSLHGGRRHRVEQDAGRAAAMTGAVTAGVRDPAKLDEPTDALLDLARTWVRVHEDASHPTDSVAARWANWSSSQWSAAAWMNAISPSRTIPTHEHMFDTVCCEQPGGTAPAWRPGHYPSTPLWVRRALRRQTRNLYRIVLSHAKAVRRLGPQGRGHDLVPGQWSVLPTADVADRSSPPL